MVRVDNLEIVAQNAGILIKGGLYKHSSRKITSYELIFVRKGCLKMFEGKKHFTINEGEYILLHPNIYHGGTLNNSDELIFYWIHFKFSNNSKNNFSHFLKIPQHDKVSRPDHITFLFRRFLEDQESTWLTQETAAIMLKLILIESAESRIFLPSSNSKEFLPNRVNAFIRSHIKENLSTSLIAKEFGYNPDYLGRIFKNVYRMSISHSIQKQKIRLASKLLIESKMNIDQVSIECGYRTTNYFRRIFKKLEDMSPYSYRKLYGRVHVNLYHQERI